ncbi:BadF/BadG/BcrA/BcrD ATPase family protein [Saccharopolyspora halophila]|uniref:BadF/BadG/BcrA/BcrD ATPase family protein n=1 Tax=Saccharopolyspora halophila TaxID=405551 RepID=A0ABP5SRM7_9PSEU
MRDEAAGLVLGLDVGGTSSRALVGDLGGRVLGSGESGGGNPNSVPPGEAVARMTEAAREALGELDPAAVRGCVVGMAGITKLSDPRFRELFSAEWARLGLRCEVEAVGDGDVSFAAGTHESGGVVLIAGTGAIAAKVREHRAIANAGGWGWLLGDEGSAYWLGREAVRATLRVLDSRSAVRGLSAAVCEHLAAHDRDALITAANARPPVHLAELAPLVTESTGEEAADIVRRAARLLADTAEAAHPDDEPIVLAGGLLTPDGRIGEAVRAELRTRGHTDLRSAGPGAAGAAWLAAQPLAPNPEALHHRFLGR